VKSTVGRMLRETGLGKWIYYKIALDAHGSKLTRDLGYLEHLSRHRKIMPLWYAYPAIHDSANIADNATVIGEVLIGDKVHIGYGTVLRADHNAIRVGHGTHLGDRTVVICASYRMPTDVP